MHAEALTRHRRSQKQDGGGGAMAIKRPTQVYKPSRRNAVAVPLGGETLL